MALLAATAAAHGFSDYDVRMIVREQKGRMLAEAARSFGQTMG